MMIVLILISILLILYCHIWQDDEELALYPIIGLIIKIGIACYLLGELIGIKVVNEKIELYEKQNKEIEVKVEEVVKKYMEFEHNTFTDLKQDSYITLVSLYPELKSDKFIGELIDLYEENNKKILQLNEQKINEKVYKWWLYFD